MDKFHVLEFEITYLTMAGERKTVIIKAHSLPEAIDKAQADANEEWYCLVNAERIKK